MKLINIVIIVVSLVLLYLYLHHTKSRILRLLVENQEYRKTVFDDAKIPINRSLRENVVFFSSYNKSYENTPFVQLHKKIITEYTLRHGYTFQTFIHPDNEMSPYWFRVKDLLYLISVLPKNTIIVYLDTDAVVRPEHFNLTIENVLNSINQSTKKSWDIYISSDPPSLDPMYSSIMNTGVFAVRNTEWSKDFIERWFAEYDHNMWSYNNNNWTCNIKQSSKKCDWARDGYEQGEFNNLFYKNKFNEKDRIIKTHWSQFASPDILEDSFIIHLMGQSNQYREQVFNEYLSKL